MGARWLNRAAGWPAICLVCVVPAALPARPASAQTAPPATPAATPASTPPAGTAAPAAPAKAAAASETGFSFLWSRALRMDFSVTERSEEFQGQKTPDEIGTAALTFNW